MVAVEFARLYSLLINIHTRAVDIVDGEVHFSLVCVDTNDGSLFIICLILGTLKGGRDQIN